ncbi:TetR/AcrR family transcriptional regulator [Amycolatopsis sp. FDAARGOS 1241]|uniref:TetR/AcrR family transcriptional regulator n=1 Tax=Amycolatopsis sp. FDAARGOS 1241 TaxID=2778070 RepID=UPI001950AB3B|nr:TetR/AcrR family transcriptional regulator [Amycolatopsis sp. FDAARGOS 1241]QRP43449.1 TetR/AcrR family transcriptional regulator [Amycolatopsis sp. FDAARGOS 1241]
MDAPRLTPKGQATRARIVEAAAELVAGRGVHGTGNGQLRARAGVSGSQLAHYFPDKAGWVRAVLEWRAGTAPAGHRRAQPDSLDRLRSWAEHVRPDEFGALAAELAKSGLDGHDEVRAGFDRWTELFRGGFQAMRDRGEPAPRADPGHLARVLPAAYQGGSLLTRAPSDGTALRDALHGALAHVTKFRKTRGVGEA